MMSIFDIPSPAVRLRRVKVPHRYEPDLFELGPWSSAAETPIPGGWVAQRSSQVGGAPDVRLITTEKALYAPPSFDIDVGDRVFHAGRVYDVEEVPSADHNPWSGWQPIREVPLTEVRDA